MQKEQQQDGATDATSQFDPRELTRLLQDDFFLTYFELVKTLHSHIRRIAAWMEGCSCHEHLMASHKTAWKTHLVLEFPNGSCPLMGCRAVELACGRLDQEVESLNMMAEQELVRQIPSIATSSDGGMILQDLQAGLIHLKIGLSVKFGFWKQLPWSLMGIAHWDKTIAQEAAGRCLFEADHWTPDMREYVMHRVAQRLLKPEGDLRTALEDFARHPQALMAEELRQVVYPWRLIPVVERVIEAQHASVSKRVIGKAFSRPAALSMALRVHEIERLLGTDQEASLLMHLQATKQSEGLAREFSLQCHPDMQPILNNAERRRKGEVFKAAQRVLYRTMLRDQFQDLRNARRRHLKNDMRKGELAKAALRADHTGHHAAAEDDARRWVLRVAMEQHVIALCQEKDRIFSLGVPQGCEPLFFLESTLEDALLLQGSGQASLRDANRSMARNASRVFFSISHTGMGRMKTVPILGALGKLRYQDKVARSVSSLVIAK